MKNFVATSMTILLAIALFLSVLIFSDCAHTVYTCQTYCEHGSNLGCDYAKPTPSGVACETVCLNAQVIDPWNLQCKSTANTCEQIARCER